MLAIKLQGLDGVMVAINKTIKEAEEGTHKALVTFAEAVEKDAKRNAPANDGKLRNSINGSVTGLQAKIVVAADYAAYLEFGTRKFAAKYVATLPQDWQSYAATFKGKGGGSFEQFIEDLLRWIKSKGIGDRAIKYQNVKATGKLRVVKDKKQQAVNDDALAYGLALHIIRNGIRAQPYLYPAVVAHTPKLIENIKKVFE